MSEIFEPYDRLVRIRILDKEVEVPENNTLLRCFQFLAPDRVPYGPYCWNGECRNCRCVRRRPDGGREEILACRTPVEEGMVLVELGEEVRFTLRKVLR